MAEGQEEEKIDRAQDIPSTKENPPDAQPTTEAEAAHGDDQAEGPESLDAEARAKENYDRYLRTLADFENYKKRTQKEQGDLIKYANERILLEILPIIDNFKRALASAKETKDYEKIVEGVEMIQKQFLSTLEKFGVRQIESLNQPFDPFHHQAVGQAPLEEGSGVAENQVVAETQTGYFLNDRVLRPSLVIVSKKPTAGQGETNKNEEESEAP